jgi:ABC-type lipoprotein export system ATPase subunit
MAATRMLRAGFVSVRSHMDLPTSGSVSVDGVDITALSERDRTLFRREHVGFIFQLFNLIPLLSVEENLLLPLELTGKDNAAGRARARDLHECVGLADRAQSYPTSSPACLATQPSLSAGSPARTACSRSACRSQGTPVECPKHPTNMVNVIPHAE